jgi:hypothetical protein
MSYVESQSTPIDLAADVEQRAKDILYKVGELWRRQAELHGRFSRRQAQDPRSPELAPMSETIEEMNRIVGALGRQRTELLDGLPIIFDARGQIDVIAEKLARDAKLVERVKDRLRRVASSIATAERVLTRVASLLA